MTTTPTRRRSRRGEGQALHDEILAAAREILAETGSEDAMSVRAVAERVGVSTPSIYLHFADKEALLDAVCEAVFAELDAVMQDAAAGVDDPFEELRQRGLAYVRFALANPEQYRIVMMSQHFSDDSDATEMLENATHQHFMESIRACQEAGVFAPDADPMGISLALWSAAHGVAALLIAKPALRAQLDVEAAAVAVITSAGLGLALLERTAHLSAQDCGAYVAELDAAFGPPQRLFG